MCRDNSCHILNQGERVPYHIKHFVLHFRTDFLFFHYSPAAGTSFLRPNQTYSPTSNEGAIYSTIDRASESQHDLSSVYSHDLYTSSPVLSKPDLDQWSLQSDLSSAEYAQLQYPTTGDGTVDTFHLLS